MIVSCRPCDIAPGLFLYKKTRHKHISGRIFEDAEHRDTAGLSDTAKRSMRARPRLAIHGGRAHGSRRVPPAPRCVSTRYPDISREGIPATSGKIAPQAIRSDLDGVRTSIG